MVLFERSVTFRHRVIMSKLAKGHSTNHPRLSGGAKERRNFGVVREDVEKMAPEVDYPEWEFRDHWCNGETAPKGWNDASIAHTQTDKWKAFAALVQGNGPLGISHEVPVTDSGETSGRITSWFLTGYCVALARRSLDRLKILDWGGGVGHYYLLHGLYCPALLSNTSCQEVPLLCEAGRALLPEARFLEEPDACFLRRNMTLSMPETPSWYCEDWRGTAAKLAKSTAGYLYITRMLFTNRADSFVAVQRPLKYGYDTEYRMLGAQST